jgi:hypothetical protein
MSAELLRRAAEKLRDGVLELPVTMNGRWTARHGVVADDGTDVGMLVVDPYNPADDAAVMRFIALLDPLVARALAEWLEATAHLWQVQVNIPTPRPYEVAEAVARAILREDS